jgi:hypothetical protein
VSRAQPPAAVVRGAMLSAAVPVGLLLAMTAAVVAPRLAPAVVLVTTGGLAAWGARAGALATGRLGGFLRHGVVRIVRLAVLLATAAAVLIVSVGVAPDDVVGLHLVVPVALTAVAFLAGRTVGRIVRRQADPLVVPAAHRSADSALMGVVAVGVGVVLAVAGVAWSSAAAWVPPRWMPLAWLVVAVVAVVAGRPAVLQARTGSTRAASEAWVRATLPLAGIITALLVVVALVLGLGLELQLRDALPELPSWQFDLFGGVADPEAPPPRRWEPSADGIGWQLAVLVAIALLLTVGRVARRRRRPQPHGLGLSLLALLRSLFGVRRSRRTIDEEEAEPVDPPNAVGSPLPVSAPRWVRRLRPRPRDPSAAILHDYRLVQRRLPPARRRRSSETVLAHAAREQAAALDELADLVCAIRFAERRPTAADAERSRQLVRTLIR